MKQILKRFGEPESDDVRHLRTMLGIPGFSQSIERIDYVDAEGNLTEKGTGTRPIGERYTLTDEGAAKHDEVRGGPE